MRVVSVVIIALLLAGCGGSSSSQPRAQSTSRLSSTPTAASVPAPTPPDPLTPIRSRLEKRGYSVQDEDVGSSTPTPEAALNVPLAGGGQVTIYALRSSTDAAKFEVSFTPIVKSKPGQIAVASKGKNVYVGTIEEPAKLSIAKFRKVIATAEGS